jgi:predicted permease
MMEGWMGHLKIAARSLGKRPGFVLTTIITLGLGIGATTAIFSVINGSLLRPLPFPESDRIVWLSEWWKDQSIPGGSSMNAANFADLRASVRSLDRMTPYTSTSANLSGADRPERVRALAVGHEFFAALGIRPFVGRDFLEEDDREGAPDVVILSYELWRDRFGADRAVVGEAILLNATPHTVIGVLSEGMEFPRLPRLFVPMRFEGQEHGRGGRQLNGIARLAPGIELETARDELMTAYARLEEAYPDENENWSAWADPLKDLAIRRSERRSLQLLGWSVVIVLLIATVNVANLLLVRAETRQRELAVRVALGAGRTRLLPHFISEGLLLSVGGGALGVLMGYSGMQGIKAAYGSMLPRADEIALDGTVLAFALAVSLGVGLLVGLIPAARTNLQDLQRDLKEGARGPAPGGSRLLQSLVVGELALAVVLLATAGLLVNSFYRVARIDVGIRAPEEVLVAQLSLPRGRYEERASRVAFFEELLAEIETIPGTVSAGITTRLPLFGGNNFTRVPVIGDPDRFANFVEWRVVTPGFFDAVGIRLEEGRMLGPEDMAADTLRTILITRELSKRLFAEESALGRRIDVFGDSVGMEVVGVVSDLRDLGHERPAPPGVYAALSPATAQGTGILLARMEGPPLQAISAVRQITTRLDADLPLYGTRTLEDVVAQRLGGRRFSIALLLAFSALAVLLGAVGIYGVMSYSVTQRTREMGVRMALGAHRIDVVRLVLRHGVRLTVLGLFLGLAGAVGATRLIESQLYEVDAADPLTYTAVALLLGAVAVIASYMPARKASRTDPLEALRHE